LQIQTWVWWYASGKVCDVDHGGGCWTKFNGRICLFVVATIGIGIGVNVIFLWKKMMLGKRFGSSFIFTNEWTLLT